MDQLADGPGSEQAVKEGQPESDLEEDEGDGHLDGFSEQSCGSGYCWLQARLTEDGM